MSSTPLATNGQAPRRFAASRASTRPGSRATRALGTPTTKRGSQRRLSAGRGRERSHGGEGSRLVRDTADLTLVALDTGSLRASTQPLVPGVGLGAGRFRGERVSQEVDPPLPGDVPAACSWADLGPTTCAREEVGARERVSFTLASGPL